MLQPRIQQICPLPPSYNPNHTEEDECTYNYIGSPDYTLQKPSTIGLWQRRSNCSSRNAWMCPDLHMHPPCLFLSWGKCAAFYELSLQKLRITSLAETRICRLLTTKTNDPLLTCTLQQLVVGVKIHRAVNAEQGTVHLSLVMHAEES